MHKVAKNLFYIKNKSLLCYQRQLLKYSQIHVSEEVRFALENKKPLVALESTIITHGMPFPQNIECAKTVEGIVRQQGAIPATIAILNGKIKVGLSESELTSLGDTDSSKPLKTSRRDLAYVVSNKLNGGTTVSGTTLVADKVGIPIFATGGIGGVHREVFETFDISADLIELGKSNVAIVSSGVKSILDIPKTLEFLETHGVFVATFGNTKDFPAFYVSKSSHKAPYNVNSPLDAANIIKTNRDLNINSAMLFAVPVPDEYSLEAEKMNKVIEEALHLAKNKFKISGKEITPFILSRVAELTQGKSLKTNIELIKNNAKTSALIAVELEKLEKETSNETKSYFNKPVIIGGSNLDINCTLETSELKLDGRIHIGKFKNQCGGVARNICESLYKIGFPSHFVTVLGKDEAGEKLKSSIPALCRDDLKISSEGRSAQCIVVFDEKKECKFLMGDLDIHSEINAEMILENVDKLRQTPLIILDGNVHLDTMSTILEIAEKYNKPVFYEPTDVEISTKPFETNHGKAVKYISPNLEELKFICSYFNITAKNEFCKMRQAASLAEKIVNYVDNVFVTLGSDGLIVSRKGAAKESFPMKNNEQIIQVRHYPANTVENIVNVSGAGDNLASGLIAGILCGLSEEISVSIGMEAAKTALKSESAVSQKIFDNYHFCWNTPAQYVSVINKS